MYLFCPWFFLVIYLAFLMLDVWTSDRLCPLCLDISEEESAGAASRSIRRRSEPCRLVSSVRRASVHAGCWRAVPRAGSAGVLCGAGAAAGASPEPARPSRSLRTRRARGRAARPPWARPRQRCAACQPTLPHRPSRCPGSSRTSDSMMRLFSPSTASLRISLGKSQDFDVLQALALQSSKHLVLWFFTEAESLRWLEHFIRRSASMKGLY